MAKKLQILRGTTAQNDAYTGSIGELTMDTEKVEVRIHDGTTQGGKIIGSGGASLPILTSIWSDHLLNDMSWLRADTFSWHSGDVYVAAYEHLAEDVEVISYIISLNSTYYRTPSDDVVINGTQYYAWTTEFGGVLLTTSATPQTSDSVYNRDGTVNIAGIQNFVTYIKGVQTETIGDITITYALAEDGHKICLPDQESNVVALYEKTGAADYYLLDTANKQFKLPRKQKRKLIQAVKNGDTWYNLYSDGWVEQGGHIDGGVGSSYTVNLPIEMSDVKYSITLGVGGKDSSGGFNSGYRNQTTTSFTFIFHNSGTSNDNFGSWQVSGYAAESEYASAGMRLEYYYVGNFEQTAVEQTAGLNAELFNGKADRNLLNTTDNVDIVIESQLPTSANGYTWYRKYKSGWVEQGGYNSTVSGQVNIVLPIEMSSSVYNIQTHALIGNNVSDTNSVNRNAAKTYIRMPFSQTTTGFAFATTGDFGQIGTYWQVSGMAA